MIHIKPMDICRVPLGRERIHYNGYNSSNDSETLLFGEIILVPRVLKTRRRGLDMWSLIISASQSAPAPALSAKQPCLSDPIWNRGTVTEYIMLEEDLEMWFFGELSEKLIIIVELLMEIKDNIEN